MATVFKLTGIPLSFSRTIFQNLRCLSSTNGLLKYNKDVGQTSIILQDGLNMQELPLIVRNVKGGDLNRDEPMRRTESNTNKNISTLPAYEEDPKEIIDAFKRCFTVKGLATLVDTMPQNEVSSFVALEAFKRIVEIKENRQFRKPSMVLDEGTTDPVETSFISQMLEVILESDNDVLLESLHIINQDVINTDFLLCREEICNTILIRVTEGAFSLQEICEAVKLFSSLKYDMKIDDIDKLWVGLVEKQNEINENNITEVYRILPYLKQSRSVVLTTLEKKFTDVWWKINGSTVAEILSHMVEVKSHNAYTLGLISRWTGTNIHTVAEDDLFVIIKGLSAADYVDDGMRKTLERYVKAKGIKIKNSCLMSSIMDYCLKFHIRSPYILQGSVEYLIRHCDVLSPPSFKSLFYCLGYFDFHPSNGILFWQVIEKFLSNKFVMFRPEDIIDVLTCCIYLEKYPINFIKKVFNPYFMDRLHSNRDLNKLRVLQTKLKIFDTAMTLECPQYNGPLLPKDHSAQTIWNDGRIKRVVNQIYNSLTEVAGDPKRISTSVLMPGFPLHEMYVIDVLFHPAGMFPVKFTSKVDEGLFICLLIHTPEHYCSEGIHLIGPQVMRKRHLEKVGLKVASLNYNKLLKLVVHPSSLQEYILEEINNAKKSKPR